MAFHRRIILSTVGTSITVLAGCTTDAGNEEATPTVSPTQSTSTPDKTDEQSDWARTFTIHATNHTSEEQTLEVTVERDDEQIVNETYELGVERGEDTSVKIGEYEQAGTYTITCTSETLKKGTQEELEVRQRYLDDCNATTGDINLMRDGRILIGLTRTDKKCRG